MAELVRVVRLDDGTTHDSTDAARAHLDNVAYKAAVSLREFGIKNSKYSEYMDNSEPGKQPTEYELAMRVYIRAADEIRELDRLGLDED